MDAFQVMGAGKMVQSASASSPVAESEFTETIAVTRAVLFFDSLPSGATLTINGKLRGKTPYKGLRHYVGEYVAIELHAAGYRTLSTELQLKQGLTQLHPLRLKKTIAELKIDSIPASGVEVWLGGKQLGTTPFTAQLPLGQVTFIIKRNGKFLNSQSVTLVDGAQTLALSSEKDEHIAALLQGFVEVPRGGFMMGCKGWGCEKEEKPQHKVTLAAFKLQATELTWNQYLPCVEAGVCAMPKDEGWGKGNLPVINVSWEYVQVYIQWLNGLGSGTFRLPSEAEWEYAARADSTMKFS